jgi:hypothetical protein
VRKSILLALMVMMSWQAWAPAAGPQDFTLSPPRVTDFKPANYLYASVETNLGQVGQMITTLTQDIASAIQAAGMSMTGGPLIVYDGANTGDPAHTFTLKVGYPVGDTAKAVGGYQLGDIGPKHCEMILFIGSVSQLRQAYGRIFARVMAAGQSVSDERAERYLYWEGENSPNNVVMIEIGVQDQAKP